MIIYAITNTITGKRYIGMTEMPLERRWWYHCRAARAGAKTALHQSIHKWGKDAFAILPFASALLNATRADLGELERAVITQESVISPAGYNMTAGGDGWPKGKASPLRGKRMSDSSREKMRLAAQRPERLAALRVRNLVMNQTDEHKAKLKAAWANSPERRTKAADTMRRVMSKEKV